MNIKYTYLTAFLTAACFIPLTINTEILDTAFNPGGTPPGTLTTTIGTASVAFGVALQSDSKIITAGTSFMTGADRFTLTRYNPNGSLDTSFGGTGIVTTLIGIDSSASDIVVQPDGKIVVAGTANILGTVQFGLARYNPDGTLDTASFGGGTGVVTTPLGIFANGFAVILQPDGKIVVAGTVDIAGVIQFMIARYNPDGTLDTTSFGGGTGIVTTIIGTNDRAQDLTLQPDGKIIVTGFTLIGGVTYFALARYNSNGTLDTSFNPTGTLPGTVTTLIGTRAAASGVALQPDGKIIAAGNATVGGIIQSALARYNSDGTLDTASFGAGTGTITTLTGTISQAAKVTLQTNGKIVTTGFATVAGITQFMLARYNQDGMLDTTFNPSGTPQGVITTEFGTSTNSQAKNLALQADGKIIAVGVTLIGGVQQFAVARYTTGSPLIQSALTIAIKEKYCF